MMKGITVLLGLVQLSLCATLDISGVIRDMHISIRNEILTMCYQQQGHPDFEWNTGVDIGICGPLGSPIAKDRTPQFLAKSSPTVTVHKKQTFDEWWHDVPGVNKVIPYTIRLSNAGNPDPRIFTYSNTSFFPIDNMGWGNEGNNHNFHFCLEAHSRFTYQGGERFNFFGDDDVFVYIDDKLVVDLGGVHSQLAAGVEVDSLGLKLGQSYRFDFFYCERHTTESNLKIETSMELFCAYYDRCGICEGNGQSCPCECDDGDACTIDGCDMITGKCIYKPVSCDDGDICTIDSCSGGVCQHTPDPCDDGNKCTTDTCIPYGGCSHKPISCDDGDACTADVCNSVTGFCANPPIECGPCVGVVCDDGDPCNPTVCQPETGICVPAPPVCDDGNMCTKDTCILTGDGSFNCSYEPLDCDDNDICTDDYCFAATGCVNTPVVCEPTSICFLNATCDPEVGCKNDQPVVCPGSDDFCKTTVCDDSVGCLTYNKTCIVDDPDCYVATCDEVNDQCVETARTPKSIACVLNLSTGEIVAAGIGTGALIGIIIAAVVLAAILIGGGKKGYDYWVSRHNQMSAATSNPIYQESDKQGSNPLFNSA